MSVLPLPPRFAILAVTGVTALSVAALSLPAPAHAQDDRVIGPIASVSGDTFQVTRPNGNATVGFTDATAVTEALPAQLGDVTVGNCIKAGPTNEGATAGGGTITAEWVSISAAVDGKCTQRPASSSAAPRPYRGVRGIVDSVVGNTVTVTRADGTGNATVTVTDTTHYHRRVSSDTHAIAAGKCAVARGDTDSNGVLQAAKITVWAPTGGSCPQPTG